MPDVWCDAVECKHNNGGKCIHDDDIELDYTATCQTNEPKTE